MLNDEQIEGVLDTVWIYDDHTRHVAKMAVREALRLADQQNAAGQVSTTSAKPNGPDTTRAPAAPDNALG